MARLFLLKPYQGHQPGEVVEVSSGDAARLVLELVGRIDRSPITEHEPTDRASTTDDTLADRENEILALQTQVIDRDRRIIDLEDEALKKDEEIEALRKAGAELAVKLEKAEGDLREANDALEHANDKAAKAEGRIAEIEALLAEATKPADPPKDDKPKTPKAK